MSKFYAIITITVLVFSSILLVSKPQDPKEPFPYEVKEVVFKNTEDNINIAGTLTIPENDGDYPLIILLNGSGAQNRDSEILGHKPFWVLADHLSRNGIATLRMDDRGVGGTGGKYGTSSLFDFVKDAEFALEYVKSQDLNVSELGVLGHSLGGTVSTIMTSKSEDIDFMVLMASGGMKGDELMLLQKAVIEKKMGMTDMQVEASGKQIEGAYDIINNNTDKNNEEIRLLVSEYFNKLYNGQLPAAQLKTITDQLTAPWFIDFVRVDPVDYLKKIDCRVLALNGENDLQVLPNENLAGIEKGLKEAGNKQLTIKKYEKLNHLMQESETGMPQEYSTIEQTIAPVVLEDIANWINGK
jgi:pimeloyl-ACP methyl ester carboxylesterase